MVLHNPNNWHWVNRDTSAWAKDYLSNELVGISAEEDGVSAKIDKVLSMDGDVDVNQRKGKVITLFDVRLQLEYTGTTKDEESVSGTITVPEVAHDTEENEYVFEIDIHSETSSKQPVKDLVRAKLTPQLRQKLATLGPALIREHGQHIQHTAASNPTALSSTAKVYSSSAINKNNGSSTPPSNASASGTRPAINVTTVIDSEEFRTSAEELFTTFTDPQRLAAFTRAPPRRFDGAQVGGKFELFDGNVTGEYTALNKPTQITQTWRLKQWPEGHYSTLSIHFDQNDMDAVTVMRVEWKGVPVGQEEVTKRNWGEYYVRSIKRTFGFGTIL